MRKTLEQIIRGMRDRRPRRKRVAPASEDQEVAAYVRKRYGRVPSYAEGGRPRPRRASVVGEFGPELFVPDVPGTIIPQERFLPPDIPYSSPLSIRPSTGLIGSTAPGVGGSFEIAPGVFVEGEATRYGPGAVDWATQLRYRRGF
jgi:hypothetical protein